jgi:hypothetical protein
MALQVSVVGALGIAEHVAVPFDGQYSVPLAAHAPMPSVQLTSCWIVGTASQPDVVFDVHWMVPLVAHNPVPTVQVALMLNPSSTNPSQLLSTPSHTSVVGALGVAEHVALPFDGQK